MLHAQYNQFLNSPIGWVECRADDHALCSLKFVERQGKHTRPNPITELAIEQLQEYFTGKRLGFSVPLGAKGTEFQQNVWRALMSVNYGQTCSYLDIAKLINNPKAVRAVGAANGKNPIAIMVPCHRVIGANGSLTGYAGGLSRKTWLLGLERGIASK